MQPIPTTSPSRCLRALASAFMLLALTSSATLLIAQVPALTEPPTDGPWGDQHGGTYLNPILPGDFSDIDAIRIGNNFYAITSTFYYSPGMAVLHSQDLVHWSFLGHVVADITQLDEEMKSDRMGRAGRGIWAGSIRFHAGRFFVYFGTPDQGIFMASAADPAGPWTAPKLVLAEPGWDDPCPFWDDDGKAYLVATRFATEPANGKKYNIHLFSMDPRGESLLRGEDRIIHQSRGSEANKLYKIHGLYFHFFSEVAPEGRVVIMERARSLAGPWEMRQVIHVNAKVDKEPNQGGLIELPSGKWYFLSHQGTGDWEGRAGVLLPVSWIDGWPVPGRLGDDKIGNMVWSGPLPLSPVAEGEGLAVSDDFSGQTLKGAWEWNYQPQPAMWSLSERPGFLRLHAAPRLRENDPRTVPDILTQRALRTRGSTVTLKLDLLGMKPGGQSGLMHYAKNVCSLAVAGGADDRHLLFARDNVPGQTVPFPDGVLWMRSTWGPDGVGSFSYSADGKLFKPIGEPCKAGWAAYRGDRIGIFSSGTAGFVDVDSFTYTTR